MSCIIITIIIAVALVVWIAHVLLFGGSAWQHAFAPTATSGATQGGGARGPMEGTGHQRAPAPPAVLGQQGPMRGQLLRKLTTFQG